MGAGWRRFTEQTRQKWKIGDREFQITPNTRNEMMLKEAGEFSMHLKRCEKDIRALKNATEGLLITSKVVLCSPLPRVYEETGGGKVVPINVNGNQGNTSAGMVPIGGTDFSPEELARISKETGKKLESEVLAPMERWMNAFALVQTRMKKLEALRLEVDSRRRTVSRMGKRVDVQRAQLPQTRARGEYDMENTIKVLQHKEAKLSACRQSYKEHEALVYHQLTNLIRDTVWLKSYLSAVLRVEAEAFQVANAALGSMKAALPAAVSGSEGMVVAAGPGNIMVNGMMEYPSADDGFDDDMQIMPESPDVIPAARSDGAPMPTRYSHKIHQHHLPHGVSMTATAATTKDSLYAMDEITRLPAAAGGYDGVESQQQQQQSESNYSRAQMAAW